MKVETVNTTDVELGTSKVISNEFSVKTNLRNREEAFRMLALAEATGLPLLFIGPPGTAKTASVRDYADARVAGGGKLFILELDEYMRPAEVKGRPDMAKLVRKDDPTYEIISPVSDADYIVINEIDKASGGMRNSMLSIMNEKVLFNGEKVINLPYRAFIGTCNVIPKDEKGNPFWDRFILKYTLSRMNIEQIMDYFKLGHKAFSQSIDIKLPTQKELSSTKVIPGLGPKMTKLVSLLYDTCSDRTISHLPTLIKAVGYIWNCGIDSSLIKVAEILGSATIATQLSDMIISKEMKGIITRIEMIPGISDPKSLKSVVHDINVLVTNYTKDGKLTKDQIVEIEEILTSVLKDKGVNIDDLKASLSK